MKGIWKNNFIKLYFGIIIILMVTVFFIFAKLLLTPSETIVTKESRIAGTYRTLSNKGIVQKEKPVIELLAKKEEQKEMVTAQIPAEQIQAEENVVEAIIEQDTTQKIKNTENHITESIIATNESNQTQDKITQIPIAQEIVQEDNRIEETIEANYAGFETIGKIEIPKTEVNTPILSNVTVKGMEKAPCLLYSTGELNKSGNNLIVGHNYRNNTLFSNNGKLQIGDEIYITSLEGIKIKYTIYDKFITTPEEVDYLQREIGDEPEITLSCCNDDDITRIVILAKENK